MKAYHNTAVLKFDDDTTGNAASGVPVTVRINSTQVLASIFDVDDVATGNPLTTDSNGNYAFKAADDIYDIIVSEGTANEVKLEKVEITENINITSSDLFLTYYFDTRQLMIDSVINFPSGKRLFVKDIKAAYIVTTGSTAEAQGSPNLTGGGYAKLQIVGCIHDITHYGAVDSDTDNTTEMQAAATQAGLLGGVYFLPIGLWIHDQIDMKSNTIMMGCGRESRDQRLSDPSNPTTTRVSYRMFNTDTVAPYDPSLNALALTCYQIHFLGTVVADGFQEFKHLIMTQGVTDLDIQTCWFSGWQGDALVIRSGNFTAAAQNINVKVKDCVFDGVNNNNRNAISITDVYGMTIRDNKFINCTRNGSPTYIAPAAYDRFDTEEGPPMPGAIDIEPNTADTYVVLNDIYIGHNTCSNIQGNVAAIGMTMPIATEDFTGQPVRNITVENNVLDDVNTGIRFSQVQNAMVTNVLTPVNVKILNNTITDATERSFWLFGMRGVVMEYNHFERCANAGAIGWIAVEENCDQIDVSNNYFRHCGTVDGSALTIYKSSNLDFIGNTFDNCGITGGGFGVLFSFTGGTSSEVRIERNTLVNNEGLTTGLFSLSGGGVIASGSGNNTYKSNNFLQLDPSAFPADFTDFGEVSSETGITALPGTQAGAFLLSTAMNVVTGGNSFDGVKLPTATGNARVITVNNSTAVSIQIYPFSGDNLGQGLNAPESLAAGNSKSYRTYDINNWIKTTF